MTSPRMGKNKNRKNKKGSVLLPPDLPPELGEDEIEVSDEDLEFVRSNKAYAGFLNKLDTNTINRHVTRVADVKEDELEDLYEKRNRKAAQKKRSAEQSEQAEHLQVEAVDALPIKTLDGKLQYRTAKDFMSYTGSKENEASVPEDNDSVKEKNISRLTKAERRQKLKKIRKEAKKNISKEEVKVEAEEKTPHAAVLANIEKDLSAGEVFANKKKKMAEIGISLLDDPEANIKSLKELLDFINDEDDKVVKLGLVSLLAVFKDIIPGYRIRLPTEKELEMKVSKEVRKLRFYESTLLRSYKTYLQKLLALEKKIAFQHIVVRCLCGLLEAVPHFNFRENLLVSVVKKLNSQDDTIRKLCCTAITSIFTEEGKHGGEAIVEAVQLISGLVKDNDCQLPPDTLEVFLSLTFDEDLGGSDSSKEERQQPKKKKQKLNVKEKKKQILSERKLDKQELAAQTREEVKADLKATSFVTDSSERRRMQSDTLSAVFETYFRILKRSMAADISRDNVNSVIRNDAHPLLAPCLRGLAKFSHLIDLDFMGDLMGCLKKLAGLGGYCTDQYPEVGLSVSERIHCCIVAFKVMRNNLDALNVDLQDFFVHLYNLLLEYKSDRGNGEVLAEALKIMLCEGKQHDMQRAAAFVKRLATFSLCFGCSEAMAALVTLKHLLQKNSKCRNLLENDAGGGSLSGLVVKYQPDATDPNLSGALASVLWELTLLSKHYHPMISSMASGIANLGPSHNHVYNSTASPMQAFSELSIEHEIFKFDVNCTLRQKKKMGRGTGRSWLRPSPVEDFEPVIDEDDINSKLENHFMVLEDIAENRRLRAELNKTVASISLYKKYKMHKKKRTRISENS